MPGVTPDTGVMDRVKEAVRAGPGEATAGPGQPLPAAGEPARRTPSALLAVLDRPLTSYYLILGITTLLLALGLVMVLSTSSVQQLDAGGSPYSGFEHQLIGVLLGLPCMWLAARSAPHSRNASLASSDAWNATGPKTISRVAPPEYVPITGVSSRPRTAMNMSG